ncbi:CAP domain-containing protein [Streptomyces sp. NPDC048291]|uniref:CAP domain-containing protein n=1 Tax=Streptomyces sp. NPDC048291 TaxID=3365530 RepID=UPI00370FF9A8
MGRHRRHAAGRATTGHATGVTESDGSYPGGHDPQDSYAGLRYGTGTAAYLRQEQEYQEYADTNARSSAYLFATEDDYARFMNTTEFPAEEFAPAGGSPSGGGHRRRKKSGRPVATGLLGVSAAVAIGTVAVATGMVPGLENYKLGGNSSTTGGERVQADGEPSNTAAEQGGTSGSAESRDTGSSTSRDTRRSGSPTASASASDSTSTSTSASPAPAKTATEKPTPTATASTEPKATPSKTATKAPVKTAAPITSSEEAVVGAEVLKLVNEERAKVGCSALSANSSLTKLAEAFSDDMAARDFFDHTDPDGKTPWDRAAAAGIANLGGENIARGQATAQAVMDAWMNSEGHRANILNCDFKTLGVGVHFGEGGPWWTQDFGY